MSSETAMKILIVSQYFWPETFRINEVAASLRDAGCEVTVLTGEPNYPDGVVFPGYRWWKVSRETHEGIPIFRVPLVPRGRASALKLVLNYLSFMLGGSLIGPWLLRGRRFEYRGIPVVVTYHPAYLLRNLPEKAKAWEDLLFARRCLREALAKGTGTI